MSSSDAHSNAHTKRIAMTLNIKPGQIQQYIDLHAHSRPQVRNALHSVGIRNLSLWNWGDRLFYYAEYIGDEPFDQAMDRYSKMDGVSDWEQLMHKYQQKLPGSEGHVWWQPCQLVYYQA
ncbi:hypothetical protein BWQ96_08633 [Gracilariopsis chorda]|uniref:L-rhamnose mutarotase n=1 Tax=Gracilariopsis chorda TaxID=448386 RepID=A0A2V3IHS6_9FLOR|nr:hypothetical protein BWQ96_08633 [Gracilariopsis chorda]|eukprot:PXF41622.1 hypothetical protein BWQ96_08633 [Gracilariopsis chorda]